MTAVSTMDPASLLRKSARLYRGNTAFVCGQRRLSYAELYERSGRLANALWGETPHAAVVLKAGSDATEAELIEWTRERVGAVKKVTAVSFVDELPRSPIGKVLRRVVREQFASEESALHGA